MSDENQTQVLIEQAVAGDEMAVRRLLVLYHPRLKGRLLRQMDAVMRSKIEPDDILQFVYLEAFRAIGQFTYQGKESFLRWLFRIMDRKLIDEHRALRAERRDVRREAAGPPKARNRTTYIDLMARVASQGGTPSQVVGRQEALGALSACLASLPPQYREVIRLRFMEGRSVADVAKIMDRTIGAIHMLCHRALRQLREEIEKLGITSDEDD